MVSPWYTLPTVPVAPLERSAHTRHAPRVRLLSCFLLLLSPVLAQAPAEPTAAAATVDRIFAEALARGRGLEHIRTITSENPGRLAGTPALARTVAWAERALRDLNVDRVYRQNVMVPHWERGQADSVHLLATTGEIRLAALALGYSGATPAPGLTAEVVEVKSLDELAALGATAVAGKIVFFNRPIDPTLYLPGLGYRGAADQRNRGPAAAARLGAVAALTRSLTHDHDDEPHAGYTGFPAGVTPIPAAALSTVAADRLSAALAADAHAQVRLDLQTRRRPDAPSHNVIGELRGSEFPDEIIVFGAHLDSWDNTPGAHDDAAGIAQCLEVIRVFQALGLKPRHTLRCVLFTNEENGLSGATAYTEAAKTAGERHLFAVESDAGGFAPAGFSIGATSGEPHLRVARWRPILERWGVWSFRAGHGGGDVDGLRELGAVVADLTPDSQRYFTYHHSAVDRVEAVNPRELHLGAGALASIVWLVDTEGL